MSAKLVVIAGADEGSVHELVEGAVVNIGRADTADFRVSDPAVSRGHCVVTFAEGEAMIKDSGSRTGTRVNGKAITDHILKPGEIIGIGGVKIRYEATLPRPKPAAAAGDGPPLAEELRKLSGAKLAHFQVGAVVAVGTSGAVFRARDTKDNRDVALKVYLPEFARNDEDLQRFVRAVKTMLPMRHPNLVTLFGGGKTGPYCWMAMEFIDGECLTDTIARIGTGGRLDWRPALNVALNVANGLYYLHSEDIIHRNLSPSNILLNKNGDAKLGSVILAKALSGALAKEVTVGDDFLGDVRYQAPEQVGAEGVVDGRADIYSLGALVYALMTGKPPFEGRTPLDTALLIMQRPPTPPRKVNPNIPAPLESIVLQMLAKKIEDRFQTAADLLAELEQLPKF